MSTQALSPAGQRLRSIWARLPERPMTGAELEAEIQRVLDRPGSEADASALSQLLVGAQAVIASRDEDGVVRYRKASEFPVWEHDVGPGSASWDEHLRELSEQEQADHDRADAAAERDSVLLRQRREEDAHVRELAREVMREELPELRRQVEQQAELRGRMRERLTKQETQTAA